MKIATFNVNGVNGRLPVLLRWLERGRAGRRLPAGTEGARARSSRQRRSARPATARSGTARRAGTASPSSPRGAEPIETRRGLPGDPDDTHSRYIEAAVERRARSAASTCPTAIRRPGRSSTTSSRWFERLDRAMPRSCWRAARRWCSPATTTSCRPSSTSTSPSAGSTTRCSGRRCAPPIAELRRAGLDRRAARAAPGRADLHLLGLLPERLGPQRRPAHRPPAAQPGASRAGSTAAGVDREVRGWEKASDHAPDLDRARRPGVRGPSRAAAKKEADMAADPFDLDRFVTAQGRCSRPRSRSCGGPKAQPLDVVHLPATARPRSLPDRAVLRHRFARRGARLSGASAARAAPRPVHASRAASKARSVHEIFGSPDDMKFRSSMTLFGAAARREDAFRPALDRWCGGRPDARTLALLEG